MIEKIMSMEEAVSRFVESGDTVFFAGMQHGEPVAAIHEIVRQHIKHLTIVPGLTLTVGMMIAEGLVDRLVTAFVRDLFDKRQSCTVLKAKRNHCYPELVDYSHFGLALGLLAGEMGVSFMPTKSLLGSDIEKHNPHIRKLRCPFTNEEMAVVEAIRPDVGIIHVQRADRYGNAQKWGSLGMDIPGINASRKIIVSAEEIVDHEIIQRDPNRTMVPGVRVNAVVEEPWGAYPIHLAGCYDEDFGSYLGEIEKRGEEAFEAYMKEYVYGVRNRRELIEKLKAVKGEAYFERLRPKKMVYSEPIGTGMQCIEVQDAVDADISEPKARAEKISWNSQE